MSRLRRNGDRYMSRPRYMSRTVRGVLARHSAWRTPGSWFMNPVNHHEKRMPRARGLKYQWPQVLNWETYI
jgi:hypothetical protein